MVSKGRQVLRVRFRNFPEDIARLWFKELIFKATGEETLEVNSEDVHVDLEITGPYNNASDLYQTPFIKRVQRLGYITLTKGTHLSKPRLAAGIQPLKTAKKVFGLLEKMNAHRKVCGMHTFHLITIWLARELYIFHFGC